MKFISLLLVVCFMFAIPVSVNAEENVVSVDDENINYVGRWIKNDEGIMEGSYECYLSLRFTGTSIALNKGSSGGMFYRVDGGEYERQSSRTLAKKLDEGEHLLEICSVAQQGFPKISGFVLDEGASTLPIEEKPVIEFIGDSILEGYVVGSNRVLNSYGHKTAEILGFYRNIVAFGGITVSPNYGNPDNQGMVNRYKLIREYSKEEPISPYWDHTKFVPDYIVINLGTNDGRVSQSEFQLWYTTFLSFLRTTYKDTKIFVMTPFNGRHRDDIIAVVDGFNDKNTYLIDSYLWNIPGGSDNLHPDVEGHDMAAEKLAQEITDILNAPPEPENTPTPTPSPAPEITPTASPDNNEENGSDNSKFDWALPAIIGSAVVLIGAITFFIIKKKKK